MKTRRERKVEHPGTGIDVREAVPFAALLRDKLVGDRVVVRVVPDELPFDVRCRDVGSE
jgi:hypothetical protein